MRGALFAAVACVALGLSPALAQMQGRGDNVPLGGGGGGAGAGSVTSVATSCGATGGTITTTGTISASVTANAQTGASYTPILTDCGKLVTLTNAGAIAVTLTNATFAAGNFINFKNLPGAAGVATLTPSAGTIDGAASLAIIPGQGLTAVFDGTNWTTSGRYVVGPSSSTSGNFASYSGTSGQLTQDSGIASAGAVFDTGPGYVAANYYPPAGPGSGVAGSAQAAAPVVNCFYGYARQTATVSNLGLYSSTIGSTGYYLAIYSNSAGSRPGTLLAYTTAAAATASGAFINAALAVNFQLVKGTPYWFCSKAGDTTEVATVLTQGNFGSSTYIGGTGAQAIQAGATVTGVSCAASACYGSALVYQNFTTDSGGGALTGATWTPITVNRMPMIAFLVASVP
jgi:hypothetical protein